MEKQANSSSIEEQALKLRCTKHEPSVSAKDTSSKSNFRHKSYRSKHKDMTAHLCESFALPDDPIFSNRTTVMDRMEMSQIDTDIADPSDLCVIAQNYINQPCLIDNLLVSDCVQTPYCHIESLLPFDIERVRYKADVEDLTSKSDELDDFDTVLRESLQMFTSTPVKDKELTSLESSKIENTVFKTINIPNKQDNLDLSILKDEVMKALEEAIKNKNAMANIDMKIQIVADLNKSHESMQKTCVEVKINDSAPSSSSSKENICFDENQAAGDNKEILNLVGTCGNLHQGGAAMELSQESSVDESLTDIKMPKTSHRKYRRERKHRKIGSQPIRRSLRSINNININNVQIEGIQTSLASSNMEHLTATNVSKRDEELKKSDGFHSLFASSDIIEENTEKLNSTIFVGSTTENEDSSLEELQIDQSQTESVTKKQKRKRLNPWLKLKQKRGRPRKKIEVSEHTMEIFDVPVLINSSQEQTFRDNFHLVNETEINSKSIIMDATSEVSQNEDSFLELQAIKHSMETSISQKRKRGRPRKMPVLVSKCQIEETKTNLDWKFQVHDLEAGITKRISPEYQTPDDTLSKPTLRSRSKPTKERTRTKYNLRQTFSSHTTDNYNQEPSRQRSPLVNLGQKNESHVNVLEPNSTHINDSLWNLQPSNNTSKVSFGLSDSVTEPDWLPDLSTQNKVHMPLNYILRNGSNQKLANDIGSVGECNIFPNLDISDELPILTREDCLEDDFEDKKTTLVKNGITNHVKIVLNPIETKRPILPPELPLLDGETKVDTVYEKTSDFHLSKIKNENQFYNCGDLVWARVRGHPYWPAIICEDPDTGKFYKEEKTKALKDVNWYHIRFFADSGRRAWMNRSFLMLYCSKDDLKLLGGKLKSEGRYRRYAMLKSLEVRRNRKWTKAVEEIESQRHKSYEEILMFMQESIEMRRNAFKQRKYNKLDVSKEGASEHCDPEEKSGNKHVKSSLSQSEGVSIGFDEINLILLGCKTETLDKSADLVPIPFSLSSELNNSKPKNLSLKLKGATSNSKNISLRRSQRSVKAVDKLDMLDLQTKKSPMVLNPVANSRKHECSGLADLNETKENGNDTTAEVGLDEMREESINTEQSDKLSEMGSKASSDSGSSMSNMYSFEYQLELHKRNNIYQGLKNVKVCDYCFKQGDLYKCKGKCNGSYHLKCASLVTEPRQKKPVRTSEKSPNKCKSRQPTSSGNSMLRKSEEGCKTRSQSQCQIISIKSKHTVESPSKEILPTELSIAEQIDFGMKEMMSKFANNILNVYDSTDSSSEEGSSVQLLNCDIMDSSAASSILPSESFRNEDTKCSDYFKMSLASEDADTMIKHVTADSDILKYAPVNITNVLCTYCRMRKDPPCFACGLEISKQGDNFRQKCSLFRCGRFYHPTCLKMWPQTQWPMTTKLTKNHPPEDSFTCPAHRCHTCFSEELGSSLSCRLPGDKLARCLLCPAAFHSTTFCTPAGCEILGGSQIMCPRHRPKLVQPINTVWCFICSEGGNLVCCDTCPTSVHPECQPVNFTDDDKYICEDCESGRFPLYDEIVWVKLGHFRWWPAIILFPNEIPENVTAVRHQLGDFVVKFFGTNDYYWVNKSRSFLFQEGDKGGSSGEATKFKSKVYETFDQAIEDAARAYALKKEFKLRREAECIDSLKPPPYVRINKNKPVGRVKSLELNLSNATACECDPNKLNPCGPETRCINRLLLTECDPVVCMAGIRCRNQLFQKRDYPPMAPYKTQGRGWGLKALAPIKKGQFVIEYVGELIDSEEYQRRIKRMHEKKDENYYFMTVDSERMIDAGPKGNLSRFMNHSCDPNCVTQKWTVKGDTRVGLFAKYDIEPGSELTFNYNLEVVGQEKKVCKCGAINCSGFIGVKAIKIEKPEKGSQNENVTVAVEVKKPRKYTKKLVTVPQVPPCFLCGRKHSEIICTNKVCNKGYHLRCLELSDVPEVTKYLCPRHNCNICSHRTIRCCVKCTNSFCPSHSELNVRYDKFLGFVCRLHDPGISSTNEQLETVKDVLKEENKPKHAAVKNLGNESDIFIKSAQAFKKHSLPRKSKVKRLKLGKIPERRLPFCTTEGKPVRSVWRLESALRKKIRSHTKATVENEVREFHDLTGSVSETRKIGTLPEKLSLESPVVHDSSSKSTADTFKTPNNKRQRAELDSTPDESMVSSTTSDEGISSRRTPHKALPIAPHDVDKDNHRVSSSPNKHDPGIFDSDDEVSLQERLRPIKRSRGHPRKRARYSANKYRRMTHCSSVILVLLG
ncbi:uncharacterized protein NSD isoform X2 [Euwallacea fornicatus]|uniref:uncharacterized protein NSD isoform X2 n=1 Tax=Euwallacea fornicatus TaxID=995702 RepID=UPI00338DEE79